MNENYKQYSHGILVHSEDATKRTTVEERAELNGSASVEGEVEGEETTEETTTEETTDEVPSLEVEEAPTGVETTEETTTEVVETPAENGE